MKIVFINILELKIETRRIFKYYGVQFTKCRNSWLSNELGIWTAVQQILLPQRVSII